MQSTKTLEQNFIHRLSSEHKKTISHIHNIEFIKTSLQDLKFTDEQQFHLLDISMQRGYSVLFQYLIENYPDSIDKKWPHGQTCLHVAVSASLKDQQPGIGLFVPSLLENGAKQIANQEGIYPLELAWEGGNRELFNTMLAVVLEDKEQLIQLLIKNNQNMFHSIPPIIAEIFNCLDKKGKDYKTANGSERNRIDKFYEEMITGLFLLGEAAALTKRKIEERYEKYNPLLAFDLEINLLCRYATEENGFYLQAFNRCHSRRQHRDADIRVQAQIKSAEIVMTQFEIIKEEGSPLSHPEVINAISVDKGGDAFPIIRAMQAFYLLEIDSPYFDITRSSSGPRFEESVRRLLDYARQLQNRLHAILSFNAMSTAAYSIETWNPNVREYYQAYYLYQYRNKKDPSGNDEVFTTDIKTLINGLQLKIGEIFFLLDISIMKRFDKIFIHLMHLLEQDPDYIKKYDHSSPLVLAVQGALKNPSSQEDLFVSTLLSYGFKASDHHLIGLVWAKKHIPLFNMILHSLLKDQSGVKALITLRGFDFYNYRGSDNIRIIEKHKVETILATAAHGDVEKMKWLMNQQGFSLATTNDAGDDAFIVAAQSKRREMLKWLLGGKGEPVFLSRVVYEEMNYDANSALTNMIDRLFDDNDKTHKSILSFSYSDNILYFDEFMMFFPYLFEYATTVNKTIELFELLAKRLIEAKTNVNLHTQFINIMEKVLKKLMVLLMETTFELNEENSPLKHHNLVILNSMCNASRPITVVRAIQIFYLCQQMNSDELDDTKQDLHAILSLNNLSGAKYFSEKTWDPLVEKYYEAYLRYRAFPANTHMTALLEKTHETVARKLEKRQSQQLPSVGGLSLFAGFNNVTNTITTTITPTAATQSFTK